MLIKMKFTFPLVILCCGVFKSVSADFDSPYIEHAADGVAIGSSEDAVEMRFLESFSGFIGDLVVTGGEPTIINDTSNKFNLNGLALSLKTPFDYEGTEDNPYVIQISSGTQIGIFKSYFGNVNDNPTYIQGDDCFIDENLDPHLTKCYYSVSDADGMMGALDIKGVQLDYQQYFDMQWENDVAPSATDTSAKVFVYAKESFDFEARRMYFFDWTVTDAEFPQFSAKTKVVVNIVDVPDVPPRWTSIIAVHTMDEESREVLTVSAIDGDAEINAGINYTCMVNGVEDSRIQCKTFSDYCNITISGIDRDKDNTDILIFTVSAIEIIEPYGRTDQEVTIIVKDIDDNDPLIDISTNNISINEYQFVKLDDKIKVTIEDIDLGINAMYSVMLESTAQNIEEALIIIPSTGYQKNTFILSIVNPSKLDYEDDTMRKFGFQIVATEQVKLTRIVKSETITFNLINWNDEIPIFAADPYTITIDETFGRFESEILPIENLKVEDRDIGDCMTFEIIGGKNKEYLDIIADITCGSSLERTVANLQIQTRNPTGAQIFDYESQPNVLLQIQASDALQTMNEPLHKTIAQININLIDVNDETPQIYIDPQSVVVKENTLGDIIGYKIWATDEDTTADLVFNINWSESSASKNGRSFSFETIGYENGVNIESTKDGTQWNAYLSFTVEPDYEIFDTMYLKIVVMDSKQAVGIGSASAIFVISVENVNDNAPVFEISTLSPKRVKENSESGTIIGIVTATDADGDLITYNLRPVGNTPDNWVVINDVTGKLLAFEGIDADVPYYDLKYNVTASDGIFSTIATIVIDITDLNDNAPMFHNFPSNYPLKEDARLGDLVVVIECTDRDRDSPNNKLQYSITGSGVNAKFSIDPDTGSITVQGELDRDEGQSVFEITVTVTDNPEDNLINRNVISDKFTLTLLDVNNKQPYLITKIMDTEENLIANTQIGIITAEDLDEGMNANVTFELVSVSKIDAKVDLHPDNFTIVKQTEYLKTAQLISKIDLRGCYGLYYLKIKLADQGVPYLDNGDGQDLQLIIAKYNFEPPFFVYPANGTKVYLSMDSKSNSLLIQYNGDPLPSITANHADNDKYNIMFTISEGNSTDFKIIQNGARSGILQMSKVPDMSEIYWIRITAVDDGTPPRSSSSDMYIGFYDLDSPPTFKGSRQQNESFKELDNSIKITLKSQASYEVQDIDGLIVYYHNYDDPNKAFKVDELTGTLSIIKTLIIEEVVESYVKIVASNSKNGAGTNPQENSIYTVYFELIDVNNNPPAFELYLYSAGIFTSTTKGSTVFTVFANDFDKGDTLRYSIGTVTTHGNGLPETDAFLMDELTGSLILNFIVTSTMTGYFEFRIIVDDGMHQDESLGKVYIITDDNLVSFLFENTVEQVSAERYRIEKVFGQNLGYLCTIDSIKESAEYTPENFHLTEAVSHCIDNTTNTPVPKATIKKLMNVMETYSSIREELRDFSIFLYAVANEFKPLLQTKQLNTQEDLEADKEIGIIVAEDLDEGMNADVTFELVSVFNVDASLDLHPEDFSIVKLDQKTANLTSRKNLRGYYGSYSLKIKLTDQGVPRLHNGEGEDLQLIIKAYNFDPPVIEYPKDGAKVYLRMDSMVNSALLQYNSDPLPSITANHVDKDKYNINFTISDGNSTDFYITQTGARSGTLRLSSVPDRSKIYWIRIDAVDDGIPIKSSSSDMYIGFYDLESPPTFKGSRQQNESFEELDNTIKITLNSQASYEVQDIDGLIVYYHKYDDPNNAFVVEIRTGTLTIRKTLVIEEVKDSYVQITASNSINGPGSNPQQNSIYTVYFELIDVNNHSPVFELNLYSAGIFTTTQKDSTIFTVYANDLDKNDVLRYSIGPVTTHGNGLPESDAFLMDQLTGSLTLNFIVTSTMTGYFEFQIIVDDGLHPDESLGKVYIVAEGDLVSFLFENTVEQVSAQRYGIEKVIGENLGYLCTIDSIKKSTIHTPENYLLTEGVTHFIVDTTNTPVPSSIINSLMKDISTYSAIRAELLDLTISLYGVVSEASPLLQTKQLNATERLQKDEEIGTIVAEKEGVNANIMFELVSVSKNFAETDLHPEDFTIVKKTSKTAQLVTLIDLRGYYGLYNLKIKLTDQGEPPVDNGEGEDLQLVIEKVNFAPSSASMPSNNLYWQIILFYMSIIYLCRLS